MTQDHYGNEVSTASQAAVDHYDTGVRLFLAAEFGAVEAFGAAVDLENGFALGHVGLARALMMAGRMPEAKAALERAQDLSGGLDHRQSQHIAYFERLFFGQVDKARPLVQQHVRDYPRDAIVAQLCTNVF